MAIKKTESKEVATKQPRDIIIKDESGLALNPERLLQEAIKNKMSDVSIEKLLDMRKEIKAEWAKEEFFKALSEFQSKCPVIEKKVKVNNKDGSKRFFYAPLEDIITTEIKNLLFDCGLSFAFSSENKDSSYVAVCTIFHKFGHSEVSKFEVPYEDSSFMSSIQKIGSTRSYANRYALCNGLGIVLKNEDIETAKEDKKNNRKEEILLKAGKLRKYLTDGQVKHFVDLRNNEAEYTEIQYKLDLELIDVIKKENNI